MDDVDRTAPEAPAAARPDAAPAADARRPAAARQAARRRVSRRALRAWAWAGAGVSFVLPWAALNAAPRPVAAPAHQVVVVPAGWRVVSVGGAAGTGGAVKLVAPGGKASGTTTAPVATTGGSAPPP